MARGAKKSSSRGLLKPFRARKRLERAWKAAAKGHFRGENGCSEALFEALPGGDTLLRLLGRLLGGAGGGGGLEDPLPSWRLEELVADS